MATVPDGLLLSFIRDLTVPSTNASSTAGLSISGVWADPVVESSVSASTEKIRRRYLVIGNLAVD